MARTDQRRTSAGHRRGAANTGSWKSLGRCISLLLMSLLLSACVAHRSVESKYEKIASELEPGDRVEIVLRDGSETTFRVTEIRPTELTGDTSTDITRGEMVTVRYEDIEKLERIDQRPAVILGIPIAGGVLAVVLILLLAAPVTF